MSDVRCPMCGKPNPEDAEVCQYCQARLKPLVKPPQPENSGQDEVDWLRGLAGSESPPANPPEESAAETPPEDMPDWLSRIRQKTEEEQDAVSPIGRPPVIDAHPDLTGPAENSPSETPEWLNGMQPPAAPASGSNWLDSLRSAGLPEEPPAQPESTASQEGTLSSEDAENDEWLRSFNVRVGTGDLVPPKEDKGAGGRSGAGPQSPSQGTGSAPPEAEVPDWLKDIGKENPPAASVPSEPAEPAGPAVMPPPLVPQPAQPTVPLDLPDWLQTFNFEGTEAGPPGSAPEQGQAALSESLPDWLKSFGAEQPSTPTAGEPPSGGAEEQAAPAEEIPDWLKSFGVEQQAAQAPAEPAAAQTAPQGEAAPAEEIPDWLKSFGVEQPAAQAPSEPMAAQGEAAPAEETPDWLKSYEVEQPAAQAPSEPVAAQGEAAPAEETPDWLKSFAAEQPTAQASAELAAPQDEVAPADETPDWLKSFAAAQPAVQAPIEPATGQETPEGEEIPDWLKSFSAEQPAAQAPAEPAAAPEGEAAPGEEMPDWLKAFATTSPPETGAVPAILPEGQVPAAGEETPAWMKSYAEQENQPAEASTAPAEEPKFVSPFGDENLPEWMKSEQAADANFTAEPAAGLIGRSEEELSAAHPFASDEMTQWLDQNQEDTAVQGTAAGEGASEGLEKAQLPAWLQAMRPVESAAPASVTGVDNDRVEKSGPLAGLRGILRAEDLVGQYQKPPAFTVKLRVSESQTVRTGLMEQILGAETEVQPPVAVPAQTSQWLVRVVTALALIALLLIVLNYGPRPLVPAALSQINPQVNLINGLVNGLQPDDPILVAVDYQSGLQGELKVAAQPLLQHLMHQGARLVFVSTNPAGPVLAQALFSSAQAAGNTGYPDEFMANLGYLVGGSTGLQALAAPLDSKANPRPLQQALPITYSSNGSWNRTALHDLKQLTDFKQVILLTDSVENGRDWVEQIQPVLARAKIPLIVVSSAQSSPLLLPYQDSGQITAMLSGLPGGAAYEQIRQSRGDGTTYWNAYLAGILAATLFILLGGVVSLISNLARPKSKRKA